MDSSEILDIWMYRVDVRVRSLWVAALLYELHV